MNTPTWYEQQLSRRLQKAALALAQAKTDLAKAEAEFDRLYREVQRRGRWNLKRREARRAKAV